MASERSDQSRGEAVPDEPAARRARLGPWRRFLPLEHHSPSSAGWKPLDDSAWWHVSLLDVRRRMEEDEQDARGMRRGFCFDNPALELWELPDASSDIGFELQRKVLFGRQRSLSF